MLVVPAMILKVSVRVLPRRLQVNFKVLTITSAFIAVKKLSSVPTRTYCLLFTDTYNTDFRQRRSEWFE